MADETPKSESQDQPEPGSGTGTADATADAGRMAEDALSGAEQAAGQLGEMSGSPNVTLPNFQQVLADVEASGLDLLHDVELNVKIELGRSSMLVEDVLRLNEGSVVELDKLAGDPVDVFVNDRLVARGEVLVLNDNFSVRINEIVGSERSDDASDREAGTSPQPPESAKQREKAASQGQAGSTDAAGNDTDAADPGSG